MQWIVNSIGLTCGLVDGDDDINAFHNVERGPQKEHSRINASPAPRSTSKVDGLMSRMDNKFSHGALSEGDDLMSDPQVQNSGCAICGIAAPDLSVFWEEDLEDDEYRIEILKDAHGAGIDIESNDGAVLIARVKKGPIRKWNTAHAEDSSLIVRVGDRIMSVNGQSGGEDDLANLLRTNQRLKLKLKRAKVFHVRIDRTGRSGNMGMEVVGGTVKSNQLKIRSVGKSGAIPSWNEEAEEDCQVEVGDRIVVVNGLREQDAMLEALNHSASVDMVVVRPPPAESPG